MAIEVTVRRRVVKRNYFQNVQLGSGYATRPKPSPTVKIIEDWRSITDLDTDYPTGEVEVDFLEEFPSIPIMAKWEVYRYLEERPGKWSRYPVFHYWGSSSPISTTGFTVYIDTSIETLTGVVIEFGFREYTP